MCVCVYTYIYIHIHSKILSVKLTLLGARAVQRPLEGQVLKV